MGLEALTSTARFFTYLIVLWLQGLAQPLSFIVWSKLPMCWGKFITYTLWYELLSTYGRGSQARKTTKQYFMPISVNSSCCHSNSHSPGPGQVAQPRTPDCLLSFPHNPTTLPLQWLLHWPRGCSHLLPYPSCCWLCCWWQRNWCCGGASNFDRAQRSWLRVSCYLRVAFSNSHCSGGLCSGTPTIILEQGHQVLSYFIWVCQTCKKFMAPQGDLPQ